jgi:ketosteroid isomerase-like protein
VNAPARHADARVARVIGFFEQLVPADLARLAQVYADDARFKDPFNDVRGVAAVRTVFAHMFATLDDPRFVIVDAVAEGDQCFLTWDFHFRLRRLRPGASVTIRGATQIRFAPDGRIALHRDWWDAAEELYEKLPALGALMRWLKRRANA